MPLKYLLPGMLLLVAFQVWPIAYTAATAFTNYGDGHLLSKEEATANIIANSVQEVEGSPRYRLSIAVPEGQDAATGDLTFLLTDPEGKYLEGTVEGLEDLPAEGVEATTTGKITAAPGLHRSSTPRQVNQRGKDLGEFAVPKGDGGIKAIGLSEAFEGRASVTYDEAADKLTDTATGKTYVPRDASWVPEDGQGEAFPQGWKENVGWENFSTLLTNDTIRAGFLKIFTWNVAFAVISVVSTFLLGMLLALLFNDDQAQGARASSGRS